MRWEDRTACRLSQTKNLQAGDVLCVDEQEGKRTIYPRKSAVHYVVEKKSFFPMGRHTLC